MDVFNPSESELHLYSYHSYERENRQLLIHLLALFLTKVKISHGINFSWDTVFSLGFALVRTPIFPTIFTHHLHFTKPVLQTCPNLKNWSFLNLTWKRNCGQILSTVTPVGKEQAIDFLPECWADTEPSGQNHPSLHKPSGELWPCWEQNHPGEQAWQSCADWPPSWAKKEPGKKKAIKSTSSCCPRLKERSGSCSHSN